MRTPFDLDVIGKNIGRSPTMIRAMSEPSGSSSGVVRGRRRVAAARLARHPTAYRLLVGKPWNDILNLWRMEAIRIAIIMVALIRVRARA